MNKANLDLVFCSTTSSLSLITSRKQMDTGWFLYKIMLFCVKLCTAYSLYVVVVFQENDSLKAFPQL